MTPIIEYLKGFMVPDDEKEARKVNNKGQQSTPRETKFYKNRDTYHHGLYVRTNKVKYVIMETQEGIVATHVGP